MWRKYAGLFSGKKGLEIGGPSPIFTPIYRTCASCDGVNFSANTAWWVKGETDTYSYSGKVLGRIFIADAVNMDCISDASYDFVMSSNNLEHLANPMKALKEFIRAAKPGGTVIIIVPNKNFCFDHKRKYTSFEHLLYDFENDTPETDLTHLPEILELHDLSMDPPAGDLEHFRQRSLDNYNNRCLHHHVFCTDTLRRMFEHLGLEVLHVGECLHNHMILGRK